MPSTTERLLLGTATVLMGLIAGFFYAYACSVMVGLAHVDDSTFITAMQWINATVRNAAFAPSFFGALAVTGAAALVAYRHRSAGRAWILAAFALYAAAFAITMGINVPLNEQLAAAGQQQASRTWRPSALRTRARGWPGTSPAPPSRPRPSPRSSARSSG